jgi:hypothetical protein
VATAAPTAVPTPTLAPTASNAPATLVLPPDKTVEANAPGGATVPFDASARDNAGNPVPVACDPKSGSLFPVGTTVVTCTATTAAGLTSQASFRVTVKASLPPTLSPQDNLAVEGNTRGGATVTFNVTAQDAVDGPLPVSCNPSSGSLFKLGTTNVTCAATNSFGQQGTRRFTVTVRDTTPPVIKQPADFPFTLPAANYIAVPTGGPVSYPIPTATDTVDGSFPASCTPPSGNSFPIGKTVVTCTAADSSGNAATPVTFTVIVTLPAPPTPTFTVTPASIQLNQYSTSASVVIQNTGTQTFNWTAGVNNANFSVSQSSGSLAPGAKVTITVTVTITRTLQEGTYTLSVGPSQFQKSVAVSFAYVIG